MLSSFLSVALLVAAPVPLPGLDVGSVIREARRVFITDGDDLVSATATHRVVSRPDGALVLEGRQSLRLEVRSVRRDGAPCEATAWSRTAAQHVVTTRRACDVVETWSNRAEGLEHELTLQAPPPGTGALRVRLAVEGPWHHHGAQGHVFAGPGAADALTYGNAFVLRDGQRLPITVAHVEGGLELVVPAALVDAPGAFPLHLDPLLFTAEVLLDPIAAPRDALATDEFEPAVATSPLNGGTALVVWVDTRRGTQTDLFGVRVNANGALTRTGNAPLVMDDGNQRHPALAWNGTNFTLAWERRLPDGGALIKYGEVSGSDQFMLPHDLEFGTAPSLAVNPEDGGVSIAWASGGTTPRVGAIAEPMTGLFTAALDAGIVNRTSLSMAEGGRFFLAVEAGSQPRVFGYWSTSPTAMFQTANGSANPSQRAPVTLVGPAADEAWLFWEEPGQVTGVHFAATAPTPVLASSLMGARSPALLMTRSGTPMLGVLSTVLFQSKVILLSLPYSGPVMQPIGAAGADELVMTEVGGNLLLVWTGRGLSRDVTIMSVRGNTVSNLMFDSLPVVAPSAPRLQRGARVSLLGETGLAVWRQGSDELRGNWLTRTAQGQFALGDAGVSLASVPTSTQIESVDVAVAPGPRALVVWREVGLQGATIRGVVVQKGTATTPLSAPFTIDGNIPAPGEDPVAAFDGTNFVAAWSRGENDVQVQRFLSDGGTTTDTLTSPENVSGLDLECLRGACLAVWQGSAMVSRHVCWGSVKPSGVGVCLPGEAVQPAVTHDGFNFQLAWRAPGGFLTASLEANDQLSPAVLISTPNPSSLLGPLRLAPGAPPVFTWVDSAAQVWVARPGLHAPKVVSSGGLVDVATTGPTIEADGVLVYQRFSSSTLSEQVFGRAITSLPDDAGVDGGVDAGPGPVVDAGVDAGVDGGVDAGAGAPDGGLAPLNFGSSGCGCNTVSPALAVFGLLGLLRRRRELRT